MNSRENQNNQKQNKSNSLIMDLENLQKKYTHLLAQYKSAVYEYANFLSQHASKPCSKFNGDSKNINQECYGNSTDYSTESEHNYKINKQNFVSIKGYAFNGTGIADQSNASTLQECEAACANLSKCSGATFISNRCLLRTGDSPIVTASEDSFAIIPKEKQLLLNMEDINQQLIETNREIANKITVIKPIYNKNTNESSNNTQELISNYKDLISERENILDLLRQYETLNSIEDQNQIKINQNYYSYILLSILAIAIIFLFYKFSFATTQTTTPVVQYGGELGINAYFIIFFLILLTIGIHYFFKYFP